MNSIRIRLLRTLLLPSSLVLVSGGVLLTWIVQHRIEADFRNALLTRANAIGALVMIDDGEIELEAQNAEALPSVYRISTADGRVISQTGVWAWDRIEPIHVRENQIRFDRIQVPEVPEHEIDDALVVTISVAPNAEPHQSAASDAGTELALPIVFVSVLESREPLEHTLAGVIAAILVIGVSVLFLISLVVWLGVRAGLRPLDRFAEAIGERTPERLNPIETINSIPTELEPIRRELDALLERIREANAREVRFTDAAAHELRTPIAELQTTLDIAQRWPEADRLRAAVVNAGEVTRRMESLVTALLALSRNPSPVQGHDARVVFAAVIRELVERHEDAIAQKSISLQVKLDDGDEWRIPEPAALLIAGNLISNTVEYTPVGGCITISIAKEQQCHTLTISNGPVDMPDGPCPQLFEPFWRSESARSNQNHHGLGLAVVEHVSKASDLRCEASCEAQALSIRLIDEDRA